MSIRRRLHAFPILLIGALLMGGCIVTAVEVLDDILVVTDTAEMPLPKPQDTPRHDYSGWHRNIIATYFDIAQYSPSQTAWNDVDPLSENPYYLALPFNDRVPGMGKYGQCKNRWVEIVNAATGKRAFGQWEDVGPWFVNDVEYVFDERCTTRPFAEIHKGERWNIYRKRSGSGVRKPRKVLNGAGIDLSPVLAQELGIGGKGEVHWRFVASRNVPSGPWKRHISTSPPRWRKRFYSFMGENLKPWEMTTTRGLGR